MATSNLSRKRSKLVNILRASFDSDSLRYEFSADGTETLLHNIRITTDFKVTSGTDSLFQNNFTSTGGTTSIQSPTVNLGTGTNATAATIGADSEDDITIAGTLDVTPKSYVDGVVHVEGTVNPNAVDVDLSSLSFTATGTTNVTTTNVTTGTTANTLAMDSDGLTFASQALTFPNKTLRVFGAGDSELLEIEFG